MQWLGKREIGGAITAAGCTLALAACGSSHKPAHAKLAVSHAKGIQFANCMRKHAVPNFPDPSGGGGGINIAGSGLNPQSPAFKSARVACARVAPGGVGDGISTTEEQFSAAVKFAKCMRTHGYSDFPDPTRSDSPPGPIFIVGNGMFFRVSSTFDPTAPAVKLVVARCTRRAG
jgi:hypothetical protein